MKRTSTSQKKFFLIFACIMLFLVLVVSFQSLGLGTKITPFFSLEKPLFHNRTPIPSNQWYTPIVTAFPTQPLYAFPLAFRLTTRGLGFSYPDVVNTPNSLFAGYNEDLTVGLNETFSKASLDTISDWSIQASLTAHNNDTLRFTLGHGIPFTTLTASQKQITLSSPYHIVVYPNNQTTPEEQNITGTTFVLMIRNHTYLVVFPAGTTIGYTGNRITSNSNQVFVALLDKRENYNNFLSVSHMQLQTTRMGFRIENQSLLTTYTFGTKDSPLVALFPHQVDFLSSKPQVLGSYKTLRGEMKLIKTRAFTTKMPLTIPPLTFTSFQLPQTLKEQIKQDTTLIFSQKPPDSQDYYKGVYFGKVATLIQLADVAGLADEKKRLITYLKPLLLTSMDSFSYDKTKTSLIAKKSEFGNDMLNDHHFHYGYYIRTAAILGREDPVFLEKITPQINEMVQDIANADRSKTTYPFLRNFDIYEGHSWAAGLPNFADGNNQESSSEALNAWYSLYLWANVTNNQQLQNYALYLFNTELVSAKYYWFDAKHIYSQPYNHAIASIVWGGKVDFSTWFSNQTNMIYGIQLLPFTPASVYLKDMGDFDRFEKDFLSHGGSYSEEWGDLMNMWKSISEAKNTEPSPSPASTFYEGTLKSTYLYFLLH